MTQRCGDTLLATIVESYHTAVAQWQLYAALTLLAGNLTCYRAVNLIGQPVLTSYCLKLEHTANILVEFILCICNVLVVTLYCLVNHDGLWRVTKHLCHIKVERLNAICLHE